ncbi:MAG: hypothetical protein K0S23_918 [Fluviicola sp.]|jgi:hypothetical protein|nr:hypothetical protein [Fluviicola sp.]
MPEYGLLIYSMLASIHSISNAIQRISLSYHQQLVPTLLHLARANQISPKKTPLNQFPPALYRPFTNQ